ncbi:MAG TPA: tripartite tricarboxylate transporter TctB family protein [Burkholderiales bacterium]|nr:tripartite tricarboxylate transporter TctB family protein [Burkholderiales bacterium]
MKSPLGADLVIPALALGFAAYFFYSIADLAWEAKANGVVIGGALVLLIAIQLARIGMRVARGEGSLRTDPLWMPREALPKRIGMVVVTVLFIATLKWLGLTLGLLLAMLAALWIMGVRKPVPLAVVPLAVAAAAYLLFIALLQSDIPHGPLEALLP